MPKWGKKKTIVQIKELAEEDNIESQVNLLKAEGSQIRESIEELKAQAEAKTKLMEAISLSLSQKRKEEEGKSMDSKKKNENKIVLGSGLCPLQGMQWRNFGNQSRTSSCPCLTMIILLAGY